MFDRLEAEMDLVLTSFFGHGMNHDKAGIGIGDIASMLIPMNP